MRLISKIVQWIRPVVDLKPQCSLYFKNEKIRSCKNSDEAEHHIKQIYNTVSLKSPNNPVDFQKKQDWSNFRENFKVDQDN